MATEARKYACIDLIMNDETWKRIIETNRPEDVSAPFASAFHALAQARRHGTTHVVAQLGMSLDGRIATNTGDSRYINDVGALTHLHRLRALVDVVLVGAGTARIDDPRLNVRKCEGLSPARVVIDPNGTVGAGAKVWTDDGARCLVFGGSSDLPAHVERLPVHGADIATSEILDALAERGLRQVLIEGGADTLARFLQQQAVDELHLLYGRVIIGSGPVGINLLPIQRLSAAPRPKGETHVFPDGDVLMTCLLKDFK